MLLEANGQLGIRLDQRPERVGVLELVPEGRLCGPVATTGQQEVDFFEVLSNSVDGWSSGCLLVGLGFDEFPVVEGGAGSDFRDEVGGSDLAPAVLG